VDGRPYVEWHQHLLYQYLFVPRMPIFAHGATTAYTFGAKRGVGLAEHVWNQLHAPSLSVEAMEAAARKLRADTVATKLSLFRNDYPVLKFWICHYVDLISIGLLTRHNVVTHLINIFVYNNHTYQERT